KLRAVLRLVAPLMTDAALPTPHAIPSKFLRTNRTVRIYLPPSYFKEPPRRYPVLYLHDGQNVFSSAGTNSCFGWGSWEMDHIADALAAEGKMREIIMVATDN